MVVAYHAGLPLATGGFIGVDVFFALSGFLIAGQLARSLDRTGRIGLRDFYARRARRLLPAAAFMLLVNALASRLLLGPLEQINFVDSTIAAGLYVSNLWFAREATNYLAAPPESNPLLHMWSLSVEEQFYLFWPLLLLVGWRLARHTGIIVVTAATCLASLGLMLHYNNTAHAWTFFGPHTRAWEFGAGALLALVSWRPPAGTVRIGGWLGLATLLTACALFDSRTPFPGMATFVPVVGAVLVIASDDPRMVSGLATLQPVGRVSYSWYLWHWPVIVFALALIPGLGISGRVVAAVMSLAIAVVAQAAIENPIRFAESLRPRPALTLALAAVLTSALTTVFVVWRAEAGREARLPSQQRFLPTPEDYEAAANDCHQSIDAAPLAFCVAGARESPVNVVLFGDSHAAQWFPALDALARSRGWALHPFTKMACPAADIDMSAVCSEWRAAVLSRIRTLAPTLVFAASASVYLAEREARMGFRDEAWAGATRRVMSSLAPLSTILLLELPQPGFDPTLCLARRAWHGWMPMDCSFERTAVKSVEQAAVIERRVAAEFSHIRVLDLSDVVCGGERCDPMQGDLIRYRDGSHMTAAFSRTLDHVLGARLDALGWPKSGKPLE
jgi:peptidoglycan/LPS O-acetylase OafA/YrhL